MLPTRFLLPLFFSFLVGCSGSGGTGAAPSPGSDGPGKNTQSPQPGTTPPDSEPEPPEDSALVPFVLPWNDGSEGITHMGQRLNHIPAGKLGSISTNSDGHFTLAGERVRFWGVNITGASCFPTHDEAGAIAARLAKFGVNLVRFHHMDHNWGGLGLIDYSEGNSRSFDQDALDRLDYFVAQLKSQGIYVNLNLINAREFSSSDSDALPDAVDGMAWKSRHVLGFFMPALRSLEKEYARKLLHHQNPYTELRYTDDPAVAFLEINNENSLLQQYYDGSIDNWPAPVREVLQGEWNNWLSNRYASTAALEQAWGAAEEPLGEEMLADQMGTLLSSGWNLEEHGSAQASVSTGTYDARQGFAVVVEETGDADWHVQFNQSSLSVREGQLYTLSFWIKSDGIDNLSVAFQEAHGAYNIKESRSLDPSAQWQKVTTSFYSPVTDSNMRINFGGLGNQVGTLYLSDISLRPGGAVGQLAEGENLEDQTIAPNLRSAGYTRERSRDWMAFVRDLEYDYWSDMHVFVRDTLSFQGLVTGTQMMNSAPSIQQEYPFIDGHAYWQHPVFPRVDWDAQDWTVANESMVNTFDNTIYQLARQRVAGKPFTVSEYQHSSPNTYSSEAPLLVAAYGALQDWDGVYLFSYDAGAGGSWSPEHFSNFFSMNAHPTKMANMALAANLFRRGDVKAAQSRVLLNFDAERELDILATSGSAWNVANGSHLGIDPSLAHMHRVALDASANPSGLEQPPQGESGARLESDTGELVWDISRNSGGVVQVDTATSKALVGFVDGQKVDLGNVTITVGDTLQQWATVGLTMQNGSFEQPQAGGNLLIVATGLTENTGMKWTSDSRNSVGNDWGESPSLVEVVPLTLELPFAAERTRAWTLDAEGQRDQALTVEHTGSGSRLEVHTATGTIWYEVEVAPAP